LKQFKNRLVKLTSPLINSWHLMPPTFFLTYAPSAEDINL